MYPIFLKFSNFNKKLNSKYILAVLVVWNFCGPSFQDGGPVAIWPFLVVKYAVNFFSEGPTPRFHDHTRFPSLRNPQLFLTVGAAPTGIGVKQGLGLRLLKGCSVQDAQQTFLDTLYFLWALPPNRKSERFVQGRTVNSVAVLRFAVLRNRIENGVGLSAV